MSDRCGQPAPHRPHYVGEGNDAWWCGGVDPKRHLSLPQPTSVTREAQEEREAQAALDLFRTPEERAARITTPEKSEAVTLRERLHNTLKPYADMAGLGGEPNPASMADAVEQVMAAWLREQVETAYESNPNLPDDLRHDLNVVAGELSGLADRIETGEA